MTPSGACLRCGGLRRWRLVQPDGNVGCWTCQRCSPPPPGVHVDLLNLVAGEPRTLLDLASEAVADERFGRELADFGAPIAIALRSLPCRCHRCKAQAHTLRDAA